MADEPTCDRCLEGDNAEAVVVSPLASPGDALVKTDASLLPRCRVACRRFGRCRFWMADLLRQLGRARRIGLDVVQGKDVVASSEPDLYAVEVALVARDSNLVVLRRSKWIGSSDHDRGAESLDWDLAVDCDRGREVARAIPAGAACQLLTVPLDTGQTLEVLYEQPHCDQPAARWLDADNAAALLCSEIGRTHLALSLCVTAVPSAARQAPSLGRVLRLVSDPVTGSWEGMCNEELAHNCRRQFAVALGPEPGSLLNASKWIVAADSRDRPVFVYFLRL